MVDLLPVRKFLPDSFERRVVRRVYVRIETSPLNFSFPLVSPEIVAGRERQRDQAQDDDDQPKDDRLRARILDHAEFCDGAEIRDPAEHRRGHEFHWHRFERPIIEKIQRRGANDFSRERD